jgi:preprotein translocase subunit SecE
MNRQTKRLLAKQQAAQEKGGGGARPAATPRVMPGGEKKKRTPPRLFLREVRAELKKVAWPTRGEVVTYSVVVLVAVIFVTFFVFGLDSGFTHLVLKVFTR